MGTQHKSSAYALCGVDHQYAAFSIIANSESLHFSDQVSSKQSFKDLRPPRLRGGKRFDLHRVYSHLPLLLRVLHVVPFSQTQRRYFIWVLNHLSNIHQIVLTDYKVVYESRYPCNVKGVKKRAKIFFTKAVSLEDVSTIPCSTKVLRVALLALRCCLDRTVMICVQSNMPHTLLTS